MSEPTRRRSDLISQMNYAQLIDAATGCRSYFPEPWRNMDPALIDRRRLKRLLPEAIEDQWLVALSARRLAALKSGEAEVIPARFVGNELVIGEGE